MAGINVSTLAVTKARDYRIDFIRGLALLTIFINHVRDNFYEKLTHKNFGLSDAAEIFVLLAGISAALAFYPKFTFGYRLETSKQIFRRITKLYFWHIASTLLVICMFVAAGLFLNRPAFFQEINIGPVIKSPVEGFAGVFMLSHQLGYFNILPMYMILLAFLPAIIWLYRYDVRLLLGASIGLYLLAGYFKINLPNYPAAGFWFFNPLSWQLLYVAGFAGFLYCREHGSIPYNKYLYWGCVIMLIWWCFWVQLGWWKMWRYVDLGVVTGALWSFNKSFVALPRLFHVLALVYVFIHSPLPGLLTKWLSGENAVVRIGQHALHLFCFGSVLAMLLLIIRMYFGGGIVLDTILVGGGIAAHVALANYLSRDRQTPKGDTFIVNGAGPTAVV